MSVKKLHPSPPQLRWKSALPPAAWTIAWLCLCAGMLLGAPGPGLAQTATPPPEVPPGFYQVDSDLGVRLYRKDYPAGNPDYVQVIDLLEGARLELMHGELKELREKKGVYGGADPNMTSLPIQTYWQQVSAQEKDAFCATNGQFFYMPEYPTRLAFPLKVDGVVVMVGGSTRMSIRS